MENAISKNHVQVKAKKDHFTKNGLKKEGQVFDLHVNELHDGKHEVVADPHGHLAEAE